VKLLVGIGLLFCILAGSIFKSEARKANDQVEFFSRPALGPYIVAAPLQIRPGEKRSIQSITDRLRENQFRELSVREPLANGTFYVNRKRRVLQFRSALDDEYYPPLSITWSNTGSISRIIAGGTEVNEARIEGEQLTHRVYESDEGTQLTYFRAARTPVFDDGKLSRSSWGIVAQAAEGRFGLAVSPKNIAAAIWENAKNRVKGAVGKPTGNTLGASTPAQQRWKNLVLRDKARSYNRKIKELFCASDLERRLNEDQIAKVYGDLIYLGVYRKKHIVGIETAARHLFNKTASNLDIGHSANIMSNVPKPEKPKK